MRAPGPQKFKPWYRNPFLRLLRFLWQMGLGRARGRRARSSRAPTSGPGKVRWDLGPRGVSNGATATSPWGRSAGGVARAPVQCDRAAPGHGIRVQGSGSDFAPFVLFVANDLGVRGEEGRGRAAPLHVAQARSAGTWVLAESLMEPRRPRRGAIRGRGRPRSSSMRQGGCGAWDSGSRIGLRFCASCAFCGEWAWGVRGEEGRGRAAPLQVVQARPEGTRALQKCRVRAPGPQNGFPTTFHP